MKAKIPPAVRQLLLVVHVAASVSLLGADLSLFTLGLSSLGGADPRTIYPAAALIGKAVIAPLAVTSLATGVLLGFFSTWGLFRHAWVTIKLGIAAALTAAVLFVLIPRLNAAAAAAGEASFSIGERLPLVVATGVASTLLIVALLLAIYKPRWEFRSRTSGIETSRAKASQPEQSR